MADRSPRSIQNPESVRRALREFDEVGREAFLAKYGVGSAKKFELVEDGRAYDAKAVLAAAFAYEFPDESALATTEFDGNDPTVRGNLERLGFHVSVVGTADEVSRAALDEFRDSAPGRLWLRVRRQRAAALRELLAVPDSVTLEMFNREVWPLESESVLRGHPAKLVTGSGEIRWESAEAADLLEALDAGELELHGNYMWGSATHVYGAMLQADDAVKTRNLQLAAEILNQSDLRPDQKAAQLQQIRGFGPNAATGLVMAFHPTEFAIYNQPSRAMVADMGYPTDTVSEFEQSVATLREELGAEDFLELDLFLYVRFLRGKRGGRGKGRSINDIQSRDSVLAAVAEFNQLGQAAFLEKYGFKTADRFFLELDGHRYDSKAIIGAAYGYEFPDRGPLRFNEFSGGAATVQRVLERLRFKVVVEPSSSGAPISFSAADCALFERFQGAEKITTGQATDEERAHLKELRARLKAMATQVAERLGKEGWVPEASLWNVHNHIGPDLWCCVYPAGAGDKAYALQIAFIVSPRGGELCFCLGSGGGKSAEAKTLAAAFDVVKQRLGAVPANTKSATTDNLGPDWAFRTSWRMEPGPSEFPSLDTWLAYASTHKGGASISRYLSRAELEQLGEQILDDMVELGRVVSPLIEFAYGDQPGVISEPDDFIEHPPEEPPAAEMEYTREWLLSRTLWPEADLDAIIETLEGPAPQVVLAGPPGTGKTWVAKQLVTYLTQGRPNCQRLVQFHPSYGYEDFLEGLRPVVDKGAMTFEPVNGIVLDIVKQIGNRKTPFYLIIDEMNRANLARVFGELMYLFEYRDEAMSLRYTPDFELPRTLRFIGTMNTADRSIRSIDIALRRRFEVFECPPSLAILEAYYHEPGHINEVDSLFSGFEQLNQKLTDRIDRHHAIGHTFFMAPTMTVNRLAGIWTRKVRPLLEEYFFDQAEMVAEEFKPESFWPALSAS
jgi:AAA domain (dynein-related subfamily)